MKDHNGHLIDGMGKLLFDPECSVCIEERAIRRENSHI